MNKQTAEMLKPTQNERVTSGILVHPIEPQSLFATLLGDLNAKVQRLEKALSYQKSVFRELDSVANRLNPDYFFKNNPACPPETSGDKKPLESIPEISGVLQDLYNQINYLSDLTKDLEYTTENEFQSTVAFFKSNI